MDKESPDISSNPLNKPHGLKRLRSFVPNEMDSPEATGRIKRLRKNNETDTVRQMAELIVLTESKPWYVNAPNQWPSVRDVGFYTQHEKLERRYYKGLLQRVRLSVNIAYDLPKSVFDQTPSPDNTPFLAGRGDRRFTEGDWSLSPSSNVCILSGYDQRQKKWVYSELDQNQWSKLTDGEKRLLGSRIYYINAEQFRTAFAGQNIYRNRFAQFENGLKRHLTDRHNQRILEKYAFFEYIDQKESSFSSRNKDLFAKGFKALSPDEKSVFLRDRRSLPRDPELIDSRNSLDAEKIAKGLLLELGHAEKHIDLAKEKMPIIAHKSNRMFTKGEAILAQESGMYILASLQKNGQPIFRSLDNYQASRLTVKDKSHLLFVSPEYQNRPPLEQYHIGLLPPESEAFNRALESDEEFKSYFLENVPISASQVRAIQSISDNSDSDESIYDLVEHSKLAPIPPSYKPIKNIWPPETDQGVYTHGEIITRYKYEKYLTKVGLDYNLFYQKNGEKRNKTNLKDNWAGKFPHDNISPPDGSGLCIQSSFFTEDGKRVYVELTKQQVNKMSFQHKEVLGFSFRDMPKDLFAIQRPADYLANHQYLSQALKKIEVQQPPMLIRDKIVNAISNKRLNDQALTEVLRSIKNSQHTPEYIKSEVKTLLDKRQNSHINLRQEMRDMVSGPTPLLWKFDENLPLLTKKEGRLFADGKQAVLNYLEGNRFGRNPSPDLWPFLASKTDDTFTYRNFKLLDGSGLCVQSRFCTEDGKRVYIELTEQQVEKISIRHKEVLGFSFRDIPKDEFATQKPADYLINRHNVFQALKEIEVLRPPPMFIREKIVNAVSNKKLNDQALTWVLHSIKGWQYTPKYVKSEVETLLDKSRNVSGKLRQDMRDMVSGPTPLLWKFDENLPLLAKKDGRLFTDDKQAFLPPDSGRCLAVNHEEFGQPTYARLNTVQAAQLTNKDMLHLGLHPDWTKGLRTLEKYLLGLLPPGSIALNDALKYDRETKDYFKKNPLERVGSNKFMFETDLASGSDKTSQPSSDFIAYPAENRNSGCHSRVGNSFAVVTVTAQKTRETAPPSLDRPRSSGMVR